MSKASSGDTLVESWKNLATRAVERFGTPLFLCRHDILTQQAKLLERLTPGLVLRQWLAVKSQPVRELLRDWKTIGYGAEVVSPFELEAALEVGYAPDRILVNGVGKHAWLRRYTLPGLRVHFDSVAEIEALAGHAIKNDWQLGFRFHPSVESDPDEPAFEDQFGFDIAEVGRAAESIRRLGVRLQGVHFHLRSNVPHVGDYVRSVTESIEACHQLGVDPWYVDCGGGLPAEGETEGSQVQCRPVFDVSAYARALCEVPARWSSVREVWVENGRFISSPSAVLVVRVLDVKERDRCRYLICDGGRTNHALVSDWQSHIVLAPPGRSGPTCLTTICGPTCMAFDWLARVQLPRSIAPGDFLIWMNAGAYHIPWENRFSFGHAAVVTMDSTGELRLIRSAETFSQWWGMWQKERDS